MPTQALSLPWCNICGRDDVRLLPGTQRCQPCDQSITQALPEVPRTAKAVLALPAGHLPHALWECKLRPRLVTMLNCKDGIFFYRESGPRWRPEKNLNDCQHLLGRYQIGFVWKSFGRRGDGMLVFSRQCKKHSLIVWKTTELAETVCRLSLLCYLEGERE